MNQLFPNCSYFHITFTVPTQSRTLLFEKRSLLNAVFSASTETVISFCKERGFLPAVTAVLHTFGSDLKRHVHIHCIVSAGGLKLTGKAERFTRFAKRKKKNSKAKKKKVSVVEDNSRWFECHFFPYKMLQKRYQTLLLEHLKKTIENNIKSSDPDHDLLIFSNPLVVKSYEHRMFLWSFDEYFLPWELIAFFLAALTASHGYIRNNIHSWIFALFYTIGLLQNTSSRHL